MKAKSGSKNIELRVSTNIKKFIDQDIKPVLCNEPYPTTLGFETKYGTFIASIPVRYALIPLFLIKNNYMKLTNCVCIDDHYISCNIEYHDLMYKKPKYDDEFSNHVLSRFYIPDCSLSQRFCEYYYDDSAKALSFLKYRSVLNKNTNTYFDCYAALGKEYYLIVKNGNIYGFDGVVKEKLTGINRKYAEFYINRYRQCYRLPLIDFEEV
ncbi:hypothetical protein [Ruminococcus sp.]|uniref:hypothetical protein n=1 Tax=Ruminococcus sp. TaxID=41978 RepID=UPI0025D0334A|nr:hypothetical protein [Ruminococcus sp.]